MNKTIFKTALISASIFLAIAAFNQVLAQVNVEGMNPEIAEDQIVTCVKDVSSTQSRGSLICHVFDIDDLDWYQEISEDNYGQIGSNNDSFSMALVD